MGAQKQGGSIRYISALLAITVGATFHVLHDGIVEGLISTTAVVLLTIASVAIAWVFRLSADERRSPNPMHAHMVHVFVDGLITAASSLNIVSLTASLVRVVAHEVLFLPVVIRVSGAHLHTALRNTGLVIVVGMGFGIVLRDNPFFLQLSLWVTALLPAYTLWQFGPVIKTYSPWQKACVSIITLAFAVVIAWIAHTLHG